MSRIFNYGLLFARSRCTAVIYACYLDPQQQRNAYANANGNGNGYYGAILSHDLFGPDTSRIGLIKFVHLIIESLFIGLAREAVYSVCQNGMFFFTYIST